MVAIVSTVLLDIYIFMLSMQVNGIAFVTVDFRMYIFIYLVIQAIVLLVLDLIAKNGVVRMTHNRFFGCVMLFLLYVGSYVLLLNFPINRMLEVLYFPLCVFITYMAYKRVKNKKVFDIIAYIQFFMLILVSVLFVYAQIFRMTDAAKNINTVYYVVFLLPFILQNKSRVQKIIGIAIIVICTFLSAKRAPIIAIGLIFILINRQTGKKHINLIVINAIIVLITAPILNYLVRETTGVDALARIMSLYEDGGSGRTELGMMVLEKYLEGSVFELFVGNNMSYSSSVVLLGAHNDFIEVLYRCGIIGFALYVMIFIALIKQARECKKNNNYDDMVMIQSTIIIFAIISFFSQLIFLPTYIGFVAMSCNFAICRNELNRKEQLQAAEISAA